MNDYKKLARELIEDHINDRLEWANTTNDNITRKDVLEGLLDDTEDVFGNLSGSRTYSTKDAQDFIDKSGAIWDDDIRSLFTDIDDGYFEQTLARGPETLDVVILELLAPQVINEMLEDGNANTDA